MGINSSKIWAFSQKTKTLFVFLLFMLSLISPGSELGSASSAEEGDMEEMSQWSKEWLELVVPYIITKKEKNIMKNSKPRMSGEMKLIFILRSAIYRCMPRRITYK